MTPADRRITELIDKWLASVDLHLQYAELSDAAYARAQDWPQHDRPTRWVLEVARQKILELKGHCETRQAMGDSRFSESLELMSFLANLVGIQHIQRFIPLADPSRPATSSSASMTIESPTVIKPAVHRARPAGDDTTREMPRLKAAAPAKAPAPAQSPARQQQSTQPSASPPAARREAAAPRATAPAKTAPASKAAAPAVPPATKAAAPSDLKGKIVADAVRLLKWGKSWHELAELIERIGERPPAAEIRKVLRANKAEIEARVAKV